MTKLFSKLAFWTMLSIGSAMLAGCANIRLPLTTLSLVSFGTEGTMPAGAATAANSPLLYNGTAATYNITGESIWTAAIGTSSWVSFSPDGSPDSGVDEPSGTYVYTSTFQDPNPENSAGTITVMGDDTMAVYLNGTLIAPAAASEQKTHCTVDVPNCIVPATYQLTGFVQGTNTLTFQVKQLFGYGTGLDFSGTVAY